MDYEYVGCFPANTRITTDNGLVRIAQIRVGDMVLSKPESGEGEPEYKPVVRTMVHDEKELWNLTYVNLKRGVNTHKLTFHKLENLAARGKMLGMEATPNHPFWVEGEGWTQLNDLQYGQIIHSKEDDIKCMVFNVSPIYATNFKNIAAVWSMRNVFDADKRGDEIDDIDHYTFYKYSELGVLEEFLNNGKDSPSPLTTDNYSNITVSKDTFKTKVYNFEVADFHTYYVWDLWVYDCSLNKDINKR